jgi:hypothetical protein
MVDRKRRFSILSADEPEGREPKAKIINEKTALKPVPKALDADDWPCFVLEDTTIYKKDGLTFGNLLNAELEGSFVVRGRLMVDEDLQNRCKILPTVPAVLECRLI